MKAKELALKIGNPEKKDWRTPDEILAQIRFAFLLNLIERFGDMEIAEHDIEAAQAAMILPSSRAYISACFGHEKVDNLGMPVKEGDPK